MKNSKNKRKVMKIFSNYNNQKFLNIIKYKLDVIKHELIVLQHCDNFQQQTSMYHAMDIMVFQLI